MSSHTCEPQRLESPSGDRLHSLKLEWPPAVVNVTSPGNPRVISEEEKMFSWLRFAIDCTGRGSGIVYRGSTLTFSGVPRYTLWLQLRLNVIPEISLLRSDGTLVCHTTWKWLLLYVCPCVSPSVNTAKVYCDITSSPWRILITMQDRTFLYLASTTNTEVGTVRFLHNDEKSESRCDD